jgi:RNA polymerase sigma factor (sigma-70 family)
MSLTTRPSMLERIRGGDNVSYEEFYKTYKPLILVRGKKDYRLNGADCDDLVQAVMAAFFKKGEAFQYNPEKGLFRNYLRKMVDNKAKNIMRKRKNLLEFHEENGNDVEADHIQEQEDVFTDEWDREWHAHVLACALNELRGELEETTIQAFDLYAMQGVAPAEVAKFLGISVNAVYLAKRRVARLVKKEVSLLNEI